MRRPPPILIWTALAAALAIPLAAAALSEQLAWRDPAHIIGGFAGIAALALLLVQPLLIANLLPGLARPRRAHQWTGAALLAAVLIHVAGLWITSPPDMIDALLFRSPTPFSPFGVTAMWAVVATAILAARRRRLHPRTWRRAHALLAGIIVAGSVIHALLIEGAMEDYSKAALCALVAAATAKALLGLRRRPRAPTP